MMNLDDDDDDNDELLAIVPVSRAELQLWDGSSTSASAAAAAAGPSSSRAAQQQQFTRPASITSSRPSSARASSLGK